MLSGSVVSALSVRVTLARCCPERSPPAVTETTDEAALSRVMPVWLKPVACVYVIVVVTPAETCSAP